MQKKKRRLLVLYSIPINLCKSLSSVIRFSSGRFAPARRRGCGALDLLVSPDSFGKGINGTRLHKREKYLVSYSIPLSCMVVLLLVMGMSVGTWSNYSDVAHAEEGISTHIDVAHPTIAMDVSRNTSDGYGNDAAGQVTTAPGAGTAYRSHKVTVTGSDIQDYQLTISGPSELTPSAGASTVVSGAGGKTGEEMSNSNSNIWGYAWGEDRDDVTTLTYNTMTDTGSNLDCTSPSADYKVNCERKLVFGANFANNAAGGTYTAEVQLSLVATPHLVGQAWSNGADTGIDDMQDIDKVDGGFCRADIPSGSTITLRDKRGGVENFYKIMKMPDGTCWMVENLRLKGNTEITPQDSDVKSNYTLPDNASVDSSTMNWGTDDGTAYMAEGSPSMKIYNNGPGWKEAYGNYYSWCAATAMSCKENRIGNAIVNIDAAESICPKNWKLPVGTTGVGSFQNLYDKYPNSSTAGWTTGQTISYNGGVSGGYNGLKLGRDSADAIFPAAGYVGSIGLETASSNGYYWSRMGGSYSSIAYYLTFYSNDVLPQNSFYERHDGFSVRCVAEADTGVWTTPSNTSVAAGVKTMQEVTKDSFSNKYCANTAAANALVPVGSTINLEDVRDDNTYTIVKLEDGRCWMQQNLRLTGNRTLKPSDSNVSSDWPMPASLTSLTKTNFSSSGGYYNAESYYQSSTLSANGVYYSFTAATAGAANSSVTNYGEVGGINGNSVCPKGWMLPIYSEYDNMLTKAGISNNSDGSTKIRGDKYKFPYAGQVNGGSLTKAGSNGYYWSRTVNNSSDAYNLGFGSNGISMGYSSYSRCFGYSVRCVAG